MHHMPIRIALAIALAGAMVAGCSRNEMKGLMDITFRVDAPGLDEGDVIYVVGNIPELGNWQPAAIPLTRVKDDRWEVHTAIPYASRIEYKFTLGNWGTEALNDDGSMPDNFHAVTTRSTTYKHTVNRWRNDPQPVGGITGEVHYHRQLAGPGILPRDVIVWLPPGYDEGLDRYPVLYMHDGQNIADPATSFIGVDWQVDETAQRLILEGRMDPVIVVGIYNSPQRMDDYGAGEQGRAYRYFVVDVVKPLIDATYRTRPDREATATMGSSMGGLVAFLLAWHHPETFRQAACLSPAFFPEVVAEVRQATAAPAGLRIYMDNGTEGLEEKIQGFCDDMMAALPEKGFREGENFMWVLDDGAEHNEAAWAARLDQPLLFLFGRPTAP